MTNYNYDFNFLLEIDDLELVNEYNRLVTHRPNDNPNDKLNDYTYKLLLMRYLVKTFKLKNYNLDWLETTTENGLYTMSFRQLVYLELIFGIKVLKPIPLN